MARQSFLEGGEDLQRFGIVALAGQEAAVTLHHAERSRIELVGALEALGGFFPLAGDVEQQRGVQVLEQGVPVGTGELVDRIGRSLRLGRACHRPGRQQRRREVGDRPADRLGELAARHRILLLLDRAHPDDEASDAIGLVDQQHALGKLDRVLDLAIGEHRQEGAAEQLVVTGIAAQSGAIVGRGRGGILLAAGVAGGQVAAGGRAAGKARGMRRLRLRAREEHSRPNDSDGECSQCGHGRTPDAWRRDHGSSTPFGGRSPSARPHWAESRVEWPV